MPFILRPDETSGPSGSAGLGRVATIGGNIATSIPDPITGVSATQTAQSGMATTLAIAQSIVLPPPPAVAMLQADPSGSILMWAQNLVRKMGGYAATPTDDVQILEYESETVDQSSRQMIQDLAMFDLDRVPATARDAMVDLWPEEDNTKAWVKAQKYLQTVTGYVPTTRTISTTAPITGGGDLSANRTFAMAAATTSVPGYLTAADWTTFNGKQAALGYTPINKAGDTGIGSLSMSTALVSGAAGGSRHYYLQTAGVNRWSVRANGTAESGANAGSDLAITAWDDAGGFLRDNLTFTRSTGAATFAATVATSTYTVATLPAGSVGMRAFVTNALTPTFGAAVVGGGAVGVPVYHDGTSWKVG